MSDVPPPKPVTLTVDVFAQTITMNSSRDVEEVIDWAVAAQRDVPPQRQEFGSLDDDRYNIRDELRTLIGRPLHFLELLKLVENYDLWSTGHDNDGDIGRRGFLGRVMCAGLSPALPACIVHPRAPANVTD